MALWATFFMEFWKRQQARIQYDWDVADYEEAEVSAMTSRAVTQVTVTSHDVTMTSRAVTVM